MRAQPTKTDQATQQSTMQSPASVKPKDNQISDELSPDNVLKLQQTIGNQAVQTWLVQRQDAPAPEAEAEATSEEGIAGSHMQIEDTPETPLDAGRVGVAISYYRQRRSQYTPDIIREMQTQINSLGLSIAVDGIIGPETVQAVARFQMILTGLPNARLASTADGIDGMAGPRTLPALFPSGLATEESIEDYADAARDVEDNWEGFG